MCVVRTTYIKKCQSFTYLWWFMRKLETELCQSFLCTHIQPLSQSNLRGTLNPYSINLKLQYHTSIWIRMFRFARHLDFFHCNIIKKEHNIFTTGPALTHRWNGVTAPNELAPTEKAVLSFWSSSSPSHLRMGTDPALKTQYSFPQTGRWTQSENHAIATCYYTTTRTPQIWLTVLCTSPNSDIILAFWTCRSCGTDAERVSSVTVSRRYYMTKKSQQEWLEFPPIHTQTQNFKTIKYYYHICHIPKTIEPSPFQFSLILLTL
jgi:hypothetical protein